MPLTSLIAKAEIAQRRLGFLACQAFCYLQCAGDLHEFGGRAFRQPELQFGVLVRRRLQSAQAARDALAQHHPILDVGI